MFRLQIGVVVLNDFPNWWVTTPTTGHSPHGQYQSKSTTRLNSMIIQVMGGAFVGHLVDV